MNSGYKEMQLNIMQVIKFETNTAAHKGKQAIVVSFRFKITRLN